MYNIEQFNELLIKKLIDFVSKVSYFDEAENYEESVLIALRWLIQIKEQANKE